MKDRLSERLPEVLAGIRRKLGEAGADALLVTQPANVRYLSAFSTPKDGRVLVTQHEVLLLSDFRYDVQANQESAVPCRIVPNWQAALPDLLPDGRLAIEADHVTVALKADLEQRLGRETVPLTGLFRDLRMVKAPFEIEALREAARIADLAFEHILGYMRPGLRELDVALELSRIMRDAGAEGDSFDTIIAGGYRSAMPHGTASDRVLEEGDLVTLDFGATWRGYHSDMTRAVALGNIEPRLRTMFDAVLEAHDAAVDAIRPGVGGASVDQVARDALARHGLEEYFTHGLGHGTGLDIHEDPRLSRTSVDVLEPGMIVTVEPGVYVNGYGGLRIEDLCLVTDTGVERISRSPRHFISL